ncbi:MAG: NAD-dependent DNA ligase LigA, partial [Candidatus Pacebacteria bacterium]|nr:NAD-dependent DNA ligase LigA [Candidatus Paceibacterota bacterium]
VVAESIFSWFKDEVNLEMLNLLLKEIKIRQANSGNQNKKIEGKSFVLTGSLVNFSRDQVKDLIRNFGGNISSAVSKNTDYLVAGDEPGSKYEKALELGVEILNEDQFSKLLK